MKSVVVLLFHDPCSYPEAIGSGCEADGEEGILPGGICNELPIAGHPLRLPVVPDPARLFLKQVANLIRHSATLVKAPLVSYPLSEFDAINLILLRHVRRSAL